MANLISDRYVLVCGEVVCESFRSKRAAQKAAAAERRENPSRIVHVYAPGSIFTGDSWGDVEGVEATDESQW